MTYQEGWLVGADCKKESKESMLSALMMTHGALKGHSVEYIKKKKHFLDHCTCIHLPNLSTQTGYDTRSVFKQTTTGIGLIRFLYDQ